MHEISTLKDHFNDMNEQNTGRLTVQDTLELLLRFYLKLCQDINVV